MCNTKIEILDIGKILPAKAVKDKTAKNSKICMQDIENKSVNISKSEDVLLTLIAKIIVEIIIKEEI